MNAILSHYPRQLVNTTAKPWIMSIPVVSTVHIPASDRQRLADYCETCAEGDVLACIEGGHGHICMLDDIDEDGGESAWSAYSPEFRLLLSAFRDHGYSYLRLDADGDVIDGWQTFD